MAEPNTPLVPNPNEPDVRAQVMAQLGSLQGKMTEKLDAVNRNYEELKTLLDQRTNDAVLKDRVAKFAEDITTRIEGIQTDVNKRVDQVEVALNRTKLSGPGDGTPDLAKQQMVRDFFHSTLVGSGKAVNFRGRESLEKKGFFTDYETYKTYRKSFEAYLRAQDVKLMEEPDLKSLQVGVDPDGGYTVTGEMSNEIITRLFEADPLRALANIETISTGYIEWLVDWGDFGVGIESETTAGAETASGNVWKKKRIDVFTLYAKPRATQTLIEDSRLNIEQWIAAKAGNRFGRFEAALFTTGTGVGQPRGFLTYGTGTDWNTVEQINMGHATQLTADGFVKVKYGLKEFFLNSTRLAWLMNRSSVSAAMQLKNGSGDYILKPAMLASDPSTFILGSPVKMGPSMPAVAANSLSVIIADWQEFYTIVDRIGITIQRDPYTVKPFVEFYTRKRVGGDVVNFDAGKIGKIAA